MLQQVNGVASLPHIGELTLSTRVDALLSHLGACGNNMGLIADLKAIIEGKTVGAEPEDLIFRLSKLYGLPLLEGEPGISPRFRFQSAVWLLMLGKLEGKE